MRLFGQEKGLKKAYQGLHDLGCGSHTAGFDLKKERTQHAVKKLHLSLMTGRDGFFLLLDLTLFSLDSI